ncbi:MAG: LytTR family DNA-binding domain-containing protein [Bacteroidota bacterium]
MQASNFELGKALIQKKTKKNQEEIFVKIGNILKRIHLKEIDWFGVDGKYAYVKTDNRNYPLSLSLKDLEGKLNHDDFIRIHQSYMVDVKKIESINLIDNFVTIKKVELPIGRSFRKQLLSQIVCF